MSTSEASRPAVRLTRRQSLKLTAGTAVAALLSTRHTGILRAAQATPGGRLVVGKPYEVTGTDPHPEANQTSWELLACCYESLLALDDALQPIPHLAESWENPDPTTFVFNLRAGVTFHNGREMTADDVAFSLTRLLDPATASFWALKMGPPIPPPAVGEGTPTPPPGIGLTIEATGPLQVTARLSEPYAPFLSTMAGINAAIVPGQEVQDGSLDLATTIVGTGPFKVLEHAEDQRWVLGRHEGYWQTDRPYADELIWQVMPDEASRVASLRSGEIQIATFENPKMLDLLAGDAAVTTVQQVTTNYYILFVNAQHAELADQRVRQAISAGINREQIRDLALFGRGTVTGPIAAGFGALASPLDQVPFYTHDPEQAKALLAEAGVSDLKLSLLVTPVLATTIPMAEVIKAQLAEVGIEIEIVQRDISTFVDEYAVQGTSQLAISWWAGFSDPYLIMISLSSTAFGPLIGLEDPAIDELIIKSAAEVDAEKRLAIVKQLETAIATTANFQPLVTRDNFIAYRNDQVGNVSFAAADGFGLPFWRRIEHWQRTA